MANYLDDAARKLAPYLNTSSDTPLENETHASEHADGGDDEIAVQDLASDAASAGDVFAADGSGGVTTLRGIQVYTKTLDYSSMSGASTAKALDGFPTNVLRGPAAVQIVTPFAGEADVAMICGDTGDDNGLVEATNLNAVAAGWLAHVPGAEAGFQFEADFSTAGADVTFTATELGDLTDGELVIHIPYIALDTV